MNKKAKLSWPNITEILKEVASNSFIYLNTESTLLLACDIAKKYLFSFYDSLIIAAALETGAKILYSEDMQHNQMIEGKLKIVNPFS